MKVVLVTAGAVAFSTAIAVGFVFGMFLEMKRYER